ncbi:hypothetical protein EPN28_01600 [Patescibacteria group bacterium]|nr:MAG: hypothetical protein EPN28_01600 [Patescibacteria group bacterium]
MAFFGAVFFGVGNALAQTGDIGQTVGQGLDVIEKPLGLPADDIRVIAARIIRIALSLIGMVLVVLILYGGFLWMTAGGNDEQIGKAKKVIINAIVGLIIIMASYAIVLFVMKMLGIGAGGGDQGGSANAPGEQNFWGSGALGKIVKDHYPTRDQTDVPRNTKIIVTFRRPVLTKSFIDDTTGDGIFGNCRDNMVSWVNDCDRVKTASGFLSDKFINIKTPSSTIAAAAVIGSASSISGVYGVYTLVIKPLTDLNNVGGGYLGSSVENIAYTVRLGSDIKLDDPPNGNPPAFNSSMYGNNYYEWKFTTGNALDLSPPFVTDVFPASSTAEAKNSVIQINFSEAMDPTGIQGKFINNAENYALEGDNIYLKSSYSAVPLGVFTLTNGYRTLEFTSSQACGKNACGNTIFCLPVCDKTGANCKQDNYRVLLKAARAIGAASFEAVPFSGAMDVSGNALDGNRDNTVNFAATGLPVFPTQETPDNYFWGFAIKDEIDLTAPYLNRVTPGLDAQNISASQEWSMAFSKRMRAESLYNIGLDQHPAQPVPLCYVPRATYSADATSVEMSHCPFLSGIKEYYYPLIPSAVEDVHYNCFYPGKGPNTEADVGTKQSLSCDEANAAACCAVVNIKNYDFCCNGSVKTNLNNQTTCLDYLKQNSL